jgi:hypothetical protein
MCRCGIYGGILVSISGCFSSFLWRMMMHHTDLSDCDFPDVVRWFEHDIGFRDAMCKYERPEQSSTMHNSSLYLQKNIKNDEILTHSEYFA